MTMQDTSGASGDITIVVQKESGPSDPPKSAPADLESDKWPAKYEGKLPPVLNKASVNCSPIQRPTLEVWTPEDQGFWLTEGRRIALRNLVVSVPCLTWGFATWLLWSMLAARLQQVHDKDLTVYNFGVSHSADATMSNEDYKALLYLLPGIAGLSGGTMRIPNSFMVRIVGGRNINAVTMFLMIIPMVLGGIGLMKKDCPFAILVIAAMLSGMGGGLFASSMSNISFFFPKAQQGFALGVNGGIGNFGVSFTQLVAPLIMNVAAFGGPLIGGTRVYNGCWLYVPILALSGILACSFMNNIAGHAPDGNLRGCTWFMVMEVASWMASSASVVVFISTRGADVFQGAGSILRAVLLIVLAAGLEHVFMVTLVPGAVRQNLREQGKVFKDKHTYIMTVLYIMCFGSFIGFSSSFPKLILDLYGYDANGEPRTDAPEPSDFAWMGAFVGSFVRPFGGVMADRWGGALVTQVSIIVAIISAVCVSFVIIKSREQNDITLFPAFLLLYLVLFTSTGVMNGSTFRQIGVLFTGNKRGVVLGWSSAIASYGAFLVPVLFGVGIKLKKPEAILFGLSGYYAVCALLNWWYYFRTNAPRPC